MWVRLFSALCVSFVLVGVVSSRAAQPELTPRSVLDGTVVIPVPVSFGLMSKEMALRVIAAGPHKPHPL